MLKSIMSLYVIAFLNLILPIIFYPAVSKLIGVSDFAFFIVLAAYFQYAGIFVEFGSSTPLVKYFAKNGNVSLHLYDLFFIKLMLSIFVSVVLFFVLILTNKFEIFPYLIGCSALVGGAINPISIFQANGMLHINAVIVFLSRLIVAFVVVFFMVNLKWVTISALMMFQFFYLILSAVFLNVYLVANEIVIPKLPNFSISALFNDKSIKKLYSESFSFFIGTIFTSSYTLITPLILDKYFNPQVTGVFGLIDRVSQPLKQILMPLLNVIYPKICGDKVDSKGKLIHYLSVFIIISFSFVSIVACLMWSKINIYIFKGQLSSIYIYCMIFNILFVSLSHVALFLYVVPFDGISAVRKIYMVMVFVFFVMVTKAIKDNDSLLIFYAMAIVELIGFLLLLFHGVNRYITHQSNMMGLK